MALATVLNIKQRREHSKEVAQEARMVADKGMDARMEGIIAMRNPRTNRLMEERTTARGAAIIAENPINPQIMHNQGGSRGWLNVAWPSNAKLLE